MTPVATTASNSFSVGEMPAGDLLRSRVHRFSVDQYHQMVEQGILNSNDPVELLSGILVRKMVKNPRHRIALNHLRDLLLAIPIDDWHLQIQDPITTDDSEPEPDLSIVLGTTDDYSDRHPEPHEVGLVIEVADSSLHDDRTWKLAIYAQCLIHEYWIVNLIDGQIEVFTNPQAGESTGYAMRRVYSPGQSVPLALAGREFALIAVSSVLP